LLIRVVFSESESRHFAFAFNWQQFFEKCNYLFEDLAKEGKHPLIIGRAEIGGCSLQKHWDLSRSVNEKPYKGKSLSIFCQSKSGIL
jgi:hypothetical protein